MNIPDLKQKLRYALIDTVRWIGRQVCRVKGHNYFYPGNLITNWCAYTCVRCGETDRPIESLPSPPEDEFFTDPYDTMPDEYVNEQYERERRWVSFLPFLHWI